MPVLEVPIADCRDGDLVAADVYNSKGLALVTKDTIMNQYIKEKLQNMGINTVKIRYYDENSHHENSLHQNSKKMMDPYTKAIAMIKDVLNDLASGKLLNVKKIKQTSEVLSENILDRENILIFLNEIRSSDQYTYTHCVRTAFYSMLMAKWLGLSENKINKAIQAGLLHDIGKSRIPLEILNKEGIITKEEYEVIKSHPIIGYEMLNKVGEEIDEEVKNAVLHHHERTDRSGYPRQASSDEVNIFGKIIAVADVFDAMTSDRVYKKRVSPFTAFEMFLTVGLSLFDTTVINTFIKNIAPYYIGSKVMLCNRQIGEVVYIPPHSITCPIIRLNSNYIDLSSNSEIKIQYTL